MFSIKALALATAVSAGVVFAMPVASQAMTSSVKVHTSAGVSVNNKDKSAAWWRRHCAISNDVKCGHHISRLNRHRHYYGHSKIYRHKPSVTVY